MTIESLSDPQRAGLFGAVGAIALVVGFDEFEGFAGGILLWIALMAGAVAAIFFIWRSATTYFVTRASPFHVTAESVRRAARTLASQHGSGSCEPARIAAGQASVELVAICRDRPSPSSSSPRRLPQGGRCGPLERGARRGESGGGGRTARRWRGGRCRAHQGRRGDRAGTGPVQVRVPALLPGIEPPRISASSRLTPESGEG